MADPIASSQYNPCPKWSLEQAHDAHDWNAPVDGPSHCPGFSAPAEGHAEPAPPQTAEEKVRDLEYVIQRVREVVGTDQPVTPTGERITALETTLREVLATFESETDRRRLAGAISINTIRRWHNVLDGEMTD